MTHSLSVMETYRHVNHVVHETGVMHWQHVAVINTHVLSTCVGQHVSVNVCRSNASVKCIGQPTLSCRPPCALCWCPLGSWACR